METFSTDDAGENPLFPESYSAIQGEMEGFHFSPDCEVAYYTRSGDQMVRSKIKG